MGCFDIHHQPSWLVLPCMSSQILVSYGYNPLDYKDLEGSYPCFLVKTAVCRGSEWLFFMKISMKKCLSCTYSPLFFGVFSWKKPSFFGDLGREKWTKLAKNAIFFTFDWLFPEKSMIWPKRQADPPRFTFFYFNWGVEDPQTVTFGVIWGSPRLRFDDLAKKSMVRTKISIKWSWNDLYGPYRQS